MKASELLKELIEITEGNLEKVQKFKNLSSEELNFKK